MDSWDYYEFSVFEAMHQVVAGSNLHIRMQAQPKKKVVHTDGVQYEEKIFHIDGVVHQNLFSEYHMKYLGRPRSASDHQNLTDKPSWTGPRNNDASALTPSPQQAFSFTANPYHYVL